jgi:hypothetical protein
MDTQVGPSLDGVDAIRLASAAMPKGESLRQKLILLFVGALLGLIPVLANLYIQRSQRAQEAVLEEERRRKEAVAQQEQKLGDASGRMIRSCPT